MFSVGEFSRLAQISKRQLRFYDELGLFRPHLVQDNGRRLYSASQLAELNRILVLQQLGFSLEQIRKLVQEHLSLAELQGMLRLKQAETEQRLEEEQQRYRAIASRLQQIERSATAEPLDVVLKAVPAQQVVSFGAQGSLEEGTQLFRQFLEEFVEDKSVRYGSFFIHLFDSEYDPEKLEGEIGRVVESSQPAQPFSTLPAVPLMATYVVTGSRHDLHLGYSAIGEWAEGNGYALAGGSREMFLQLPGDMSSAVTEVQVPVQMLHFSRAQRTHPRSD
jgi:DNA-binding transcriptional MerR regulator